MKRAIVIGASSGIGKETALLLAQNGYRVGITGRRTELLNEVVSGADNILALPFDITASDAVEQLKELIRLLGGLDLLLLSSGTGHLNQELVYEREAETNVINVEAFTRIIDFAYIYFAQQSAGHIAAITSVMGLRGAAGAPAYAASKAYQINYLEGLQQKTTKEKREIAITDIRPGSVNTDMMKGEGHFWVASPKQAAHIILRAIQKKKKVQYVTPRWWFIGFILKSLPRPLHRILL